MDGNTENQSSRLYVICSNCGYEADCSENDTEVICPSCGEPIPTELIAAARQNLQKSNPEFVMEQQKLIRYSGKASRVIVPSTVNEISPRAFAGCESLQEVSIPDVINRIPQSAFEGCVNLQKVTLPENLYRIDTNAFKDCAGLKEIQLPASVRIIEDGAFAGVNSLNYKTLFKNNVQYGSALKIADPQLAKQYQNVLKAKGKTDEKPKRKIPAYVYAIAAAVLLIGGFFIKKEMDFSSQMKLAESYVRSGSYEKGISAYERALELKNQDRNAQSAMKQAYKSWGDSLLADGRYEDAIDKYSHLALGDGYIKNVYLKWGDDLRAQGSYDKAIEKYSNDPDSMQYVEETYLEWADTYAETSDFDGAVKILEEGKENLSHQSYVSEEINDKITDLEYKAELKEKLLAIAQNVDAGELEDALKQIDPFNAEMSGINEKLNGQLPFIVETEHGSYDRIGLYWTYTNYCTVYYGEYSGNTRQGNGYYLYSWNDSTETTSFEYCFGQWDNDKPNGIQNVHKWMYENGVQTYSVEQSVNVSDGVFDGDVVWKDNIIGKSYNGRFEDGYFTVLSEESSGGETWKYVLHGDNGEKLGYANGEGLDSRWCIFGYD